MALYTTVFSESKPAKINGLKSEVVFREVKLNWNAAIDNNICYYRVYDDLDKSFIPNKNNQIGSTISNTFHFQYKDNSRLYFKVRAVDKYGNEGE